jgi:hypothetical protein
MTVPPTSWDKVPVYGTWVTQAGDLMGGKYKVTVPTRVTSITDDVIIPAGVFARGELQITDTLLPSFSVDVPSTNDPDISEEGWKLVVEVHLDNGTTENYVLEVPFDADPINLRECILSTFLPKQVATFKVGEAGGFALLDGDGDVIDADGTKVLPVGLDLEGVQDAVGAMIVAGTNVTVTYNDVAGTLTIAASPGAGYTDEQVRDVIGAALVGSTNLTVTVNDGADTITLTVTGLTDADIAPVAENPQTGTTYTFVMNDKHRRVRATNSSAQTYTIPTNASVAFPVGTVLNVLTAGTGQVTFVGAGGTTVHGAHGLKSNGQWTYVQIEKIGTDEWVVSGDTTT